MQSTLFLEKNVHFHFQDSFSVGSAAFSFHCKAVVVSAFDSRAFSLFQILYNCNFPIPNLFQMELATISWISCREGSGVGGI